MKPERYINGDGRTRCRFVARQGGAHGCPDHYNRVRSRETALLRRRHRAGVPGQAVLQPHHALRHRPPTDHGAQQCRGGELRRLPDRTRVRHRHHAARHHQRSAGRTCRHRDHRRHGHRAAAHEHDDQRPLRAVHIQGEHRDRGREERRHRLRGRRHEHRHRPDAVRRSVRHQRQPAAADSRCDDLLGRRAAHPDHRRPGVSGHHPLRRAQEHRGRRQPGGGHQLRLVPDRPGADHPHRADRGGQRSGPRVAHYRRDRGQRSDPAADRADDRGTRCSCRTASCRRRSRSTRIPPPR